MLGMPDFEPAHDAILAAAVEDDDAARSLDRHEVGKPVDELRGATEPSGVQDVVAVEEVQRRLRLRHALPLYDVRPRTAAAPPPH